MRSESALIQTIGRVARNSDGRAILFADTITGSMERAIKETARRRKIQDEFNKAHGIVPQTIKKDIVNTLEISKKVTTKLKKEDISKEIERLTGLMKIASNQLDFESAMKFRDEINQLKKQQKGK